MFAEAMIKMAQSPRLKLNRVSCCSGSKLRQTYSKKKTWIEHQNQKQMPDVKKIPICKKIAAISTARVQPTRKKKNKIPSSTVNVNTLRIGFVHWNTPTSLKRVFESRY